MCCPSEITPIDGILTPTKIAMESDGEEVICHIQGVLDRTPPTLGDRIRRFFQRLELVEKIAEIADESFHFLGSLFQRYTPLTVYQALRQVHDAAHHIEHVLHATCFLGDLSSLLTGELFQRSKSRFFVYSDDDPTKLDKLRSLSRLCHAVSHFFATVTFLSEAKLIHFWGLERAFKYAPFFSASGYLLWTSSLIWRRHPQEIKRHMVSEMTIHLSGFLFEAIPMVKILADVSSYSHVINKITAIAGMIHAAALIWYLMPPDREEVSGHFKMPAKLEQKLKEIIIQGQ